MPIQRLYWVEDGMEEAEGDWVDEPGYWCRSEDVAALEAENARLKQGHCWDCCCARSWEALGNPDDGRSIPEHIAALKAKLAALEGQTCETCADGGDAALSAKIFCNLNKRCWPRDHGCRAWKERTDG